MNSHCIISGFKEFSNSLKLFYSGKCIKSAWLENTDKHFPDIFLVIAVPSENSLIIPEMTIRKIHEKQISVKLVISDDYEKILYSIKEDVFLKKEILGLKIGIHITNELLFSSVSNLNKSELEVFDYERISENFSLFLRKRNMPSFIQFEKRNIPLSVIVIGSCFVRSVFKSDSYFNPNYKLFFNVKYTFFHNSLISLMSNPITDNSYLKFKDLAQEEILKYVKNEFQKNIFTIIDSIKPDYIIMDNYIDANRPLIQISENQYLTYNSYFSKSIYKKNFINCKILYNFEDEFTKLYRNYAKIFSTELKSRNLDKKFILLGNRLSESKLNTITGEVKSWENPDYWIRPSNKNWNIVDKILLEEISNAVYIDMRDTKWMSDENCTAIKGGASPSHYQSEYYKEIFEKIKTIAIK